MIPYGKQDISEEDVQAVVDVLRSDFITQGQTTLNFEEAICKYVNCRYAVAVNSGTSALHLACLALGLEKGDYLWTTPVSFVASSNCALYCQAAVDFVDIDSDTFNISIAALQQKLNLAKKQNKLPKIIVAVHISGLSCNMEKLYALSKEFGFKIIEDACHALGGTYKDLPIGQGSYSHIAVFSFHPVKSITTGEGGMAVTNNLQWAEKMRLLRSHGITRNPELMTHKPDGDWYYQQLDLGFNYRMSDIHAALGISQLKRLDLFIHKRLRIAARYNVELSKLPVRLPKQNTDSLNAYHLYVIQLLPEAKMTKRELFNALRLKGISTNVHYIPIHTQPYYQQMGFQSGDYPAAENYYKCSLSIPIFPSLTLEQQSYIINTLTELLL